jgi:hypothetical protein
MTQKTSFALHHVVLDRLRSTPGIRENIHAFSVAATNAYLATRPSPMDMRRLGDKLDSLVCRESPLTFSPPRTNSYPLSHYKAAARNLGVSLSALVANAVTAALGMHPGSPS